MADRGAVPPMEVGTLPWAFLLLKSKYSFIISKI
jgi:hypothetical protein